MDNLQFIWSGESELPAGWALQPHVHDFFHLAYVQRGALIFHADGVPYPLSHGSLILLPPGVTHAIPGDSHNLCSQIEVMFRLTDPLLQGLLDTRTVRAPRCRPFGAVIFLYSAALHQRRSPAHPMHRLFPADDPVFAADGRSEFL